MLAEQSHGARLGVDVDPPPPTPIEQIGIGKPDRMVRANVDVKSGLFFFQHPIKNQVLSILSEGPQRLKVPVSE
jgi:hypothetical protein